MLVQVVPRRRLLRALVDGLRFYQWSGLGKVVRRSGLLHVLGLERQEEQAPLVPPRAARRDWPEVLPPLGLRRARVLFLRGCVTPELLPEMVRASIAALRHNGCEVLTPRDQACCGALHFHTGYRERGLELLARNVRAFDLRDVDAVVVNAAGCGSSLKEYGDLAADRPDLAPGAAALAARVRDLHEFLHDLGLRPPQQPIHARVAYDEPCHLLHGQRITDDPRLARRPTDHFWMCAISKTGGPGRKYFDELVHVDFASGRITDSYRLPERFYFGSEPTFLPDPNAAASGLVLCKRSDAEQRRDAYLLFDPYAVAKGPVAVLHCEEATPSCFHASYYPSAGSNQRS